MSWARVRQVAERDKNARFTALLHHVSVERLQDAFGALRPKAAAGVDGVTWHAYEQNLEHNLRDLHARVHRGGYRAKPSRRVYIPKADGRQRPLGIAALEDKIVQRGVVEVLNAIYEEDFLGFSYGFRPRHSQHDALDALAVGIYRKKVNWMLDCDVADFFTRIDHSWLERFLEHRIADKRVLRLIQKWLEAGVIENGEWTACDEGTPQGAKASPLLAKVKAELMRGRHRPLPEQGQWLARVVRGHLNYYAVPGNIRAIRAFCSQVSRHWYGALRRRSQRSRLNWNRMGRLTTRWLPPARVVHPYPGDRFDAITRGKNPVR